MTIDLIRGQELQREITNAVKATVLSGSEVAINIPKAEIAEKPSLEQSFNLSPQIG